MLEKILKNLLTPLSFIGAAVFFSYTGQNLESNGYIKESCFNAKPFSKKIICGAQRINRRINFEIDLFLKRLKITKKGIVAANRVQNLETLKKFEKFKRGFDFSYLPEKGSKKGEEGHTVYYTTYDDMGILSEKIYNAGKNLDYKDPPFKLPKNFGIMKEYCQKFCEFTEINFVRIDFYEVDGEVYFGEYTFVPNLCVHKLNTQYEKYLLDKYNLKV